MSWLYWLNPTHVGYKIRWPVVNLDRNENEVSNAFISTIQAAILDRVDEDNRKLHQHFPLTLSFILLCPSEGLD